MRLLLDTHVWLWSLLDPARISKRAARALADPLNELWVSPISTWEILVLSRKKRVELKPDAETWIADTLSRVPLREAPLTHDVAIATAAVELPHRDPADRFLAATAKAYGLTLVTSDQHLLSGSGFEVLPAR